MPRALLLINPKSRNGQTDLDPAMDVFHDAGLELVTPKAPCDFAEAIAENADKVDRVIVGGGDGTLSAVVDALLDCGLPLGVLPLGTANDLARTLNLPTDLQACAHIISKEQTRRIDLGEVNGKHFFNVASLGLSIEVTRNLSGDLKARLGILGYAVGLWRAIDRRRVIKGAIRIDDEREDLRAIQISIGNGRHYGGGMTIAAGADIDDGMLDLVIVPPQPLLPWLHRFLMFRWGRHDLNPNVRHHRAREIHLETKTEFPINTDGEVTARTPARFRILPKALDVFVP